MVMERTFQERPSTLALSAEDQHHLDQMEAKLQVVRDRTAGVAKRYATGLFVHGDGGVGKSYTVLEELRRLKATYKVFNARMTGRGLFDVLKANPDAVHVLEDMEPIMLDKPAQGVLRSALWGQRSDGDGSWMERLVTWTTARKVESFVFEGGIILTSNRPLENLPELNAIRTRISVYHLQPSVAELQALMRFVSAKGYQHEGKHITPHECLEICEYLIDQALSLDRPLDMRLLLGCFQDNLQYQENDAGCHWHDLVRARLYERHARFREEVAVGGRAARKQMEMEIAREIRDLDRDDRLRIWSERTGKSESALYRRLEELKREDYQILTFRQSEN